MSWDDYRNLKDENVEVQQPDQIRFNAGSETIKHAVGKLLVGYVGSQNGYNVASEVETQHGEIDVVLFGHESRHNLAVEVETGLDRITAADKAERYIDRHEHLTDVLFVETTDLPHNMTEAADHVAECLGLEI
jgi:hypothetical protein